MNYIRNPLTKRLIQYGGKTHKDLMKHYLQKGGKVHSYEDIIIAEGGIKKFSAQKLVDLRNKYGNEWFPQWWQKVITRNSDWDEEFDDINKVTIGDLVATLDYDYIKTFSKHQTPHEFVKTRLIHSDNETLDKYDELYNTIKNLGASVATNYEDIIIAEGGLKKFYAQKLVDLYNKYGEEWFPQWWQKVITRTSDWDEEFDDINKVTIAELLATLDYDTIKTFNKHQTPHEFVKTRFIYSDNEKLDKYDELYNTIKALKL
jgi:hypothetical protein